VSGGAFRLTHGPVNLASVVVEVFDERTGAIATFLGTVRAQSRDRDVIALEYEAYEEMAEDVMAQIAAEVDDRYDLRKLAMTHRLGRWRSARRASRSPLRAAPAGRTRRLRGPHRSAEGAGATQEEGALREGGEEWIGRGS
jgi:hypothetical protein